MNRQSVIATAFDKIYRNRGFRYLRPLEAYEIFISIIRPKKGKKILDVGSGLGLLLKLMVREGLMAYGVDISDEAVERSKAYCPEATIIKANAEDLPFKDKEFQYITCIGSLERMIDREKVIRELIRVASDDARFCIMVRNSNHFSWRLIQRPFGLYNQYTHQAALTYKECMQLFTSCGLRILAVYPDHWPYYRFRLSIPFWGKRIDYAKIRRFPLSLDLAYEFIFLLEKDG